MPTIIAALVFAACLSITAIVGITHSSGVKQGEKKILCSVGIFAEKLLDGSPTEDWVGAQIAVKDFQDVLGDFYPMVAKLTAAPSLTAAAVASGMTVTLTAGQAATQLMYTTNSNKIVKPRPDPAKVPPTYVPAYIKVIYL